MTTVPCPCCGHLTLSARSRFEICPACRRKDDGQDDAGALPHVAPRRRVAAALRAAVVAHERGDFGDIGLLHDQLEGMSLGAADRDVSIAINFLDGWCDSSNHDWSYYEPLVAADWPALASRLAAHLESGTPIADAVRDQFEFKPSRGPLAWVRSLFRRSPRHQASPPTSPVPVHRRYVSWGRDEIEGLPVEWSRVVTEIDPNGRVLREIGLNAKGGVVHRAPSAIDTYGLFDQVPIDAGPDSDPTAEEFEGWWQAALEPPVR